VLLAGATVVMAKHPHSDLYPFTLIPEHGKPMILASSSSQDAAGEFMCAMLIVLLQ
jgi:hypothetical protein